MVIQELQETYGAECEKSDDKNEQRKYLPDGSGPTTPKNTEAVEQYLLII